MKNKQARQSARDVYSYLFLDAEINSPRYHWAFDRLRNSECGFKRHVSFMRFKEFDSVSIKSDRVKN